MARPVKPVTTTRAAIRITVVPLVHCDRFAPTATLLQQDSSVSTIVLSAMRQTRRIETTRLIASGSDLRHRDTCTSRKATSSGTKNIANE
jgi:hypothetical protein